MIPVASISGECVRDNAHPFVEFFSWAWKSESNMLVPAPSYPVNIGKPDKSTKVSNLTVEQGEPKLEKGTSGGGGLQEASRNLDLTINNK